MGPTISHFEVALEVWEQRHYIALWDAMVNGNFEAANMPDWPGSGF